jgi:hypothetical protein
MLSVIHTERKYHTALHVFDQTRETEEGRLQTANAPAR